MDGNDNEVVFRDEEPEREESAPPTPITTYDMDVIIRGWEEKFSKLTECLREVQLASERAGSDMCLVSQEARAQGQDQERRLGTMQEGLADFLRRFETTRTPTTPHVDALRASTPHGIPLGPEYAQILDTSHHQWAETRFYIQNTARCRTPGVRAPRIRQTVWKHIWDPRATRCRTSGVRAQGIRMMFEKRAARCRTPVVRAQGNK